MHLQKFNQGSGTRIIAHVERDRKTKTESNIDYTKTKDNYSLFDCNLNLYKEKCKELVKRKDAITLCDVVLTLPESMKYEPIRKQQMFFMDALEGIIKHWGGQPIFAEVHMDETTPHLHYGFMPIKDGKLQAKNIVTRQALKTFHGAVEEHIHAKGWKDVFLQEQDEEQREINHALGIATKSLSEFRKDAIEANSEKVEEAIIEVQKELRRSARSVKKQKGESKEEYRERKAERIEVNREDYETLLSLRASIDAQNLKARYEVQKKEEQNARERLNKSEKDYIEACSTLDQEKAQIKAEYERKMGAMQRQHEADLKTVATETKNEVLTKVTTRLYNALAPEDGDPQKPEKEQNACKITSDIVGRSNVLSILDRLSFGIKRAFDRFFGQDRTHSHDLR